jgi:hypothetical protein
VSHPATAKFDCDGATTDSPRPLRVVFFGESIVSDWGNPAATTVRAVMRALVKAGHEALFLEERQNRATVELLRARGASAVRAFAERYADLRYRTYDLPRGLERTVWFVRQVATADAVVILDDAPAGVREEAGRLDTPHLTRVSWSAIEAASDPPWADLRLRPEGAGAPPGTISCGPAVEHARPDTDEPRSGLLLVAYDDDAAAVAARAKLAGFALECLSAGSVTGDGWTFVPEVALPDRYRQALVAVVAGAGDEPFAAARLLLPLASGCHAIGALDAARRPESIAARLTTGSTSPAVLPARFDATTVARRLVEAVRQARRATLS